MEEQKKDNIRTLIKNNPSLLEDSNFVLANLSSINKNFKDFPNKFKKNDLFIQLFFSTITTTHAQYSFIPKHLLDNPFFISSCLLKNPDIYFLIDKSFHNDPSFYSYLEKTHPNTLLKYANEEQLKDENYCIEHIKKYPLNYLFANEDIRSKNDLINYIFKKIGENTSIKEILNAIPQPLINDPLFITNLVFKHNIHVFPYLPKSYLEDPNFCRSVVLAKSDFFQYASDVLKHDINWVNSILSTKVNASFHFGDIFTSLRKEDFTFEFCTMHSQRISIFYPKFPKNIRALKEVMIAAFSHPDQNKLYINNSHQYSRHAPNPYNNPELNYINCVPDEEIKKAIKQYRKDNFPLFNSIDQNKSLISNEIIHLIKNIQTFNKLKTNLIIKENSPNTIKI